MSALKILPDIYSVGVVDWNIRNFHGHTFTTKRGTSYNSYLIVDEKIALVDTVMATFSAELIGNIRQVIAPEKIDYIIVNHVENDHSGALPEMLKLAPRAKLFGTQKCKEGLYRHYYGNWDFQTVKTGDKLSLGKRTLIFLEAPMLHWPDSMFTYCPEEELLLPNDAFGQHYASSGKFDDEVDQGILMEEAAKYYANILWPLSALVLKKIEEVKRLNLPIKMIAPSHGVIWRKDPAKIINSYLSWAGNQTLPKAVVVYETMWGATEKMAKKIADGLIDSGIEVKIFDVNESSRTEIIAAMLDSKGYLVGSSTHDNDMLCTIASFLEFLKGLKPKNRISGVFGSYGWAGGAIKNMEGTLKEAGVEIVLPSLGVQYVPDENELKKCYEFGRAFADKIKHPAL